MILTLGLLFATAAPPCVPIEKDIITAVDLAAVHPEFSAIAPSRIISYAPAPGRRRVFGVAELRAIAESNGVSYTPSQEICFTWPVHPIDDGVAAEAMQESFPDATIDIIELSRFPAPSGKLVFPRTGLQRVPAPEMLWRGHVLYGAGKRFDVWARVAINVKQARVVSTEMLRPGTPIREDQVRLESADGPPQAERFATQLTDVVGRVARTTLIAGAAIKTSDVELPPEITRGDLVSVQVVNGGARIGLDALAVNTARLGEIVQLTNQSSGRTFRAKVSGFGRAVILLGERN